MSTEKKTVFMIGIGGIGMCALAIYLCDLGYQVLGMDDSLRDDVRQMLLSKSVRLPSDESLES